MNETTPLKAIRLKCLRCCLGSFREVELCPATDCPLHPYRKGHATAGKSQRDTKAAIIARCRDCAGDGQDAIEHCSIEQCPLYGFRPAHQSQTRARRRPVLTECRA